MSTISPAAVKNLRDRTNAPMMECKAALTEAGGDMEKAVEILRKKLAKVIDKRVDREAAEGRIAVFIDPVQKAGAIVELRCESAPVAKTEQFVQLASDLARQAALKSPATIDDLLAQPFIDDPKKTIADRIKEVIGLIRENMKVARFKRLTGVLGSYCHHDGSVGVLLQVEGKDPADEQLLRDVCMHITARNPVAARPEDLPAAVLDKEKEIARSQVAADPKNAKKPANIIDKIIEGKIKTWLAENVLVEQPFVKDDTRSVGDVLKGAGLELKQFVRFKVGEITER
jgi:elongation factor Ts